MSIKELLSVVPPPREVIEPGSEEAWLAIQRELELDLPRDLFDFGTHYGSGAFHGGFLQVFNPFWAEYRDVIAVQLSILVDIRKSIAGSVPYSIHPEKEGLFPIARDDNGNRVFWLMEGHPDTWPIVLQSESNQWERWDMPMTTFFAKALNNEITCLIWQPFGAEAREFEPGERD